MNSFGHPGVAAAFDAYPKDIRARLLRLRRLIFEVAARTERVGPLEETLKWGQPSYLTARSGSGSTIRIGHVKSRPGNQAARYAMYFHCLTTLIDTFREMYRDRFSFEGNRAIVFDANQEIPAEELSHCISLALTYHRDRKQRSRA